MHSRQHNHRREHIGQNMQKHDLESALTQRVGGGDIFHFAYFKDFSADDLCIDRPAGDA